MNSNNQLRQMSVPSFSNLKLHDEDPMCPECGAICQLHSRKSQWKCCSYTVTVSDWDVVRLHAATVKNIFLGEGINTIIFSQVPIDIDSAVSCSHLLPVIIEKANESARSEGLTPLLKVIEVSDEACENCLLPFSIEIETEGCTISESLTHLTAIIRNSIKTGFNDEGATAALDFKYVNEPSWE